MTHDVRVDHLARRGVRTSTRLRSGASGSGGHDTRCAARYGESSMP